MYLRYLSHTSTCTFTHLVLGLLAKIKYSMGASQVAQLSSVAQSCPTLCDPVHGLQHARLPCPLSTPGVHSNSCPLSRWCHPRWHSGKESAANAGDARDVGFIPGVGNGNSLQYSCLNNSVDRGAWWPTVQGSQRAGHNWATTRTHTQHRRMSLDEQKFLILMNSSAFLWEVFEKVF